MRPANPLKADGPYCCPSHLQPYRGEQDGAEPFNFQAGDCHGGSHGDCGPEGSTKEATGKEIVLVCSFLEALLLTFTRAFTLDQQQL